MVEDAKLIILSLKYQDYLTYIGVLWTVGISLFVAIISYMLIYSQFLSIFTLIMMGLILIFTEIIFIAVYFWINKEKNRILDIIKQKGF